MQRICEIVPRVFRSKMHNARTWRGQELADLAPPPMRLLTFEPDDQALDLRGQLVGIAHWPARATNRRRSSITEHSFHGIDTSPQGNRPDARSSQTLLLSLFEYKAWANDTLFAQMAQLAPGTQPVELNAVLRVLNHVYVVDRIFAAHLSGEKHDYTATNTPETPSLESLRNAVVASDRWYVDYVGKMSPQSLREEISFTFVDGALGCMSREEILAHVATHGDYHRGAAGRIMSQASVEPFTVYLHTIEPRRRGRT